MQSESDTVIGYVTGLTSTFHYTVVLMRHWKSSAIQRSYRDGKFAFSPVIRHFTGSGFTANFMKRNSAKFHSCNFHWHYEILGLIIYLE